MRRAFLALILLPVLAATACASPAGPWRTVLDNPTSPYVTVNVEYAPLDVDRTLQSMNVIFRGEVKSTQDIQVSWESSDGQQDAYLSTKEITVKDVLYGALPRNDTLHAVGNASWEIGELDVRLRIGEEYYFLAHVYGEDDRQAQQNNPDNQLRDFELGDVRLLGTTYCVMPADDGVVRFWSEWPLEGVALPTEHPYSLGQGTVMMPQQEFERKLLDLVHEAKGKATPAPSATR